MSDGHSFKKIGKEDVKRLQLGGFKNDRDRITVTAGLTDEESESLMRDIHNLTYHKIRLRNLLRTHMRITGNNIHNHEDLLEFAEDMEDEVDPLLHKYVYQHMLPELIQEREKFGPSNYMQYGDEKRYFPLSFSNKK